MNISHWPYTAVLTVLVLLIIVGLLGFASAVLERRKFSGWMVAALFFLGLGRANAQTPAYPAHSWTYNADFKDPDALAAAVDRLLRNGMWFGGLRYDPISVYHVDDSDGSASRWGRLGICAIGNSERNSVVVGLHVGLDVAQWTSKAKVAGAVSSFAKLWKPLGFASVTATVDVFGGPMLYHTPDVKGPADYGYGFSVQGKFGGAGDAAALGNSIIKGGL